MFIKIQHKYKDKSVVFTVQEFISGSELKAKVMLGRLVEELAQSGHLDAKAVSYIGSDHMTYELDEDTAELLHKI